MNTAATNDFARASSLAHRAGHICRWTRTLIPTLREAPSDATVPSHQLMLRAGLMRQVAAGVYDYLPLGWRSITKVANIVREEMDAAGSAEIFLPVLVPMELYAGTKRDEAYGDLLFQLEDRHGRRAALGPTHEETITELCKSAITSYKQFPLTLYQIQTKFRDEFRPRAGLLRGREFLMKDAYSFHLVQEGEGGLDETYDRLHAAYTSMFIRCGLDFTIVEAESGPIGGSASHEFMVNAETGEDTILICEKSGYAANVEKCEIGERPWKFTPHAQQLTDHHTPGMPGIDKVVEHLGIQASGMLKSVVFSNTEAGNRKWIVAVVRGDHDVNEAKVRDAVGFAVQLADEKEAKQAGFAIGYVSPRVVATIANTTLLIDPDAATGLATGVWATGADTKDHHVTGFDWARDLGSPLPVDQVATDAGRGCSVRVVGVRNAEPGDPSPKAAGSRLVARRGIEVAHIFKLGTKYSDAFDFAMMDKAQQRQPVTMGCYGIGVSRTVAAAIEQNHDDAGIRWPMAIAPYHVLIVLMKPDDADHAAHAERIAAELSEAGIDVLIDDRAERPGVKFKDADLIGLPIRLTLGAKSLEEGAVEFKLRSDDSKGDLVPIAEVVARCVSEVERGLAAKA